MKHFKIRLAGLEDAHAIADVHVRCWRALYGGMLDQKYLDGMDGRQRLATWRSNLEKTGAHYSVYVAELGGEIGGFTTLGRSDETEGKAEMYSIYLDPAWHGRGIGSSLFREGLGWAKSGAFSSLSAWVFKAYGPGHEFYKHMGGRLISKSEKNLVIDKIPYAIVSYEWIL